MQTKNYARIPFYVEAVQVTAENMDEIATWTKSDIKSRRPIAERGETEEVFYVKVDVTRPSSERQTRAYIGDWVLLHENGTWKVFSDKAFGNCFVSSIPNEEMTNLDVEVEKALENENQEV